MTLSTVTPSWADTNESDADAEAAGEYLKIESDQVDTRWKAHIATDDKRFALAESGRELHLTSEAEPDSSQVQLSPGDKAEAARLTQEYKELQDEQKKLAKRLRGIEAKLRKLGVPMKTVYVIRGEVAKAPKYIYSFSTDAKGGIAVPSDLDPVVSAIRPVPVPIARPKPHPEPAVAPAAPEEPGRTGARDSSVEKRLRRLEKMMEELIDATKSSSDHPLRRGR